MCLFVVGHIFAIGGSLSIYPPVSAGGLQSGRARAAPPLLPRVVTPDENMVLRDDIPNFTWGEVLAGFTPGERFWRHMVLLQGLREWWGAPLQITSGYRSRVHNEAVGGAGKSQHLEFATAVQPNLPSPLLANVPDEKRLARAIELFAVEAQVRGYTGIGRYDTFVHLDLRPGSLVKWDNRNGK